MPLFHLFQQEGKGWAPQLASDIDSREALVAIYYNDSTSSSPIPPLLFYEESELAVFLGPELDESLPRGCLHDHGESWFSRVSGDPCVEAIALRRSLTKRCGGDPGYMVSGPAYMDKTDLTYQEAKAIAGEEGEGDVDTRRRTCGLATSTFRKFTGGKCPQVPLAG